jgi:DNA-binding beta-propeller fold protein YncE
MGRWVFAITSLLALVSRLVLGQAVEPIQVLKVREPVAISGVPERGYYVLSADGAIYQYKSGASLTFSATFSLPPGGQATDIAFSSIGQQNTVLASSWSTAQGTGWIFMYSSEGRMLHSWRAPRVVSGLAIDEQNQMLFFTSYTGSAESNELYKINLRGGEPEFVCSIPGVARSGAIALDAANHAAYVADFFGGKLVRIDLSSKRNSVIAAGLGLPSALLLDQDKRVLYFTDGLNKSVFAINLQENLSLKPFPVAASAMFRSPSGLAHGPEGTLLITDAKAGAVFLLRPTLRVTNPAQRKKGL